MRGLFDLGKGPHGRETVRYYHRNRRRSGSGRRQRQTQPNSDEEFDPVDKIEILRELNRRYNLSQSPTPLKPKQCNRYDGESDALFYLAATSCILLVSLTSLNPTPPSSRLAAQCLSGLQFVLSLVGAVLRLDSKCIPRKLGGIVGRLIVPIMTITQTTLSYLLLHYRTGLSMAGISILHPNLFYSTWIGFGLVSFLLGGEVGRTMHRHQHVGKQSRVRNLVMSLFFQVAVLASCISLSTGPICMGSLSGSSSCRRLTVGLGWSSTGILLSFASLTLEWFRFNELPQTFISLIPRIVVAGVLVSDGGMGSNPGNLFVAIWVDLLLGILLFLRAVEGMCSRIETGDRQLQMGYDDPKIMMLISHGTLGSNYGREEVVANDTMLAYPTKLSQSNRSINTPSTSSSDEEEGERVDIECAVLNETFSQKMPTSQRKFLPTPPTQLDRPDPDESIQESQGPKTGRIEASITRDYASSRSGGTEQEAKIMYGMKYLEEKSSRSPPEKREKDPLHHLDTSSTPPSPPSYIEETKYCHSSDEMLDLSKGRGTKYRSSRKHDKPSRVKSNRSSQNTPSPVDNESRIERIRPSTRRQDDSSHHLVFDETLEVENTIGRKVSASQRNERDQSMHMPPTTNTTRFPSQNYDGIVGNTKFDVNSKRTQSPTVESVVDQDEEYHIEDDTRKSALSSARKQTRKSSKVSSSYNTRDFDRCIGDVFSSPKKSSRSRKNNVIDSTVDTSSQKSFSSLSDAFVKEDVASVPTISPSSIVDAAVRSVSTAAAKFTSQDCITSKFSSVASSKVSKPNLSIPCGDDVGESKSMRKSNSSKASIARSSSKQSNAPSSYDKVSSKGRVPSVYSSTVERTDEVGTARPRTSLRSHSTHTTRHSSDKGAIPASLSSAASKKSSSPPSTMSSYKSLASTVHTPLPTDDEGSASSSDVETVSNHSKGGSFQIRTKSPAPLSTTRKSLASTYNTPGPTDDEESNTSIALETVSTQSNNDSFKNLATSRHSILVNRNEQSNVQKVPTFGYNPTPSLRKLLRPPENESERISTNINSWQYQSSSDFNSWEPAPVSTIRTTATQDDSVISEPTLDNSIRTRNISRPPFHDTKKAVARSETLQSSRRLNESIGKISMDGRGDVQDVNKIVEAAIAVAMKQRDSSFRNNFPPKCGGIGSIPPPPLVRRSLKKSNESAAVGSIESIHSYYSKSVFSDSQPYGC